MSGLPYSNLALILTSAGEWIPRLIAKVHLSGLKSRLLVHLSGLDLLDRDLSPWRVIGQVQDFNLLGVSTQPNNSRLLPYFLNKSDRTWRKRPFSMNDDHFRCVALLGFRVIKRWFRLTHCSNALTQDSEFPATWAVCRISSSSASWKFLKHLMARTWLSVTSCSKHGGKPRPATRKPKIVRIHFSQRPQFRSSCLPSQHTLRFCKASDQLAISWIFCWRVNPAPSWTIWNAVWDSKWSVTGFEPLGSIRFW